MKKLKEKMVLQSNGLAEIFELQSLTKCSYAIQKSYDVERKVQHGISKEHVEIYRQKTKCSGRYNRPYGEENN